MQILPDTSAHTHTLTQKYLSAAALPKQNNWNGCTEGNIYGWQTNQYVEPSIYPTVHSSILVISFNGSKVSG